MLGRSAVLELWHRFFAGFASLLRQRTGGRVDFMREEKVKAVAMNQEVLLAWGRHRQLFGQQQEEQFSTGINTVSALVFYIKVPERRYEAGILADSCCRWLYVVRNLA